MKYIRTMNPRVESSSMISLSHEEYFCICIVLDFDLREIIARKLNAMSVLVLLMITSHISPLMMT